MQTISNRIVLSVGTWDVPHMGHAIFLQNAAKLGTLVVGINSDKYIEQYKGKKPVFDLTERSSLVKMLDCVAGVVINNQDSLRPLLEEVKPDFLVIGSDWGDRYFEQIKLTKDELKELGVQLVYLPYTKEISTTAIIGRVHDFLTTKA